MLSLGQRFQDRAKKIVDKAGKAYTYRKVSEQSYDFETQSVVSSSQDTAIKAFKVDASFSEKNQPNLIGRQLFVFLVPTAYVPTRPAPQDMIVEGLDVYTILEVRDYAAGDREAMWRVIATNA